MICSSSKPHVTHSKHSALPHSSAQFQQVLSEIIALTRSSGPNTKESSETIYLHSGHREDSSSDRCNSGHCQDSTSDRCNSFDQHNQSNDRHIIHLPDIWAPCPPDPEMGTTCSSSNTYDHREWHNLTDGYSADFNKHGRSGKRKQAQGSSEVTNGAINDVTCTCSAGIEGGTFPEVGGKQQLDKPGAKNNCSDSSVHQSPISRLSASVDTKLSKVFSNGRARATSSCDVSPHRLLTRRNHSPSGRSFTFDPRFSSEAMRQRSLSWSHGKYGYLKPARSSVKSPTIHNKLLLSNSLPISQREPNGVNLKPKDPKISSDPCTQSSVEVHDASCPLHIKTTDNKAMLSFIKLDSADPCLSPVMRRRSASESHTTRPRRTLPRTPEHSETDNGQEHVHVRWADEEDGSALSTSVSLSSIRPRSYSYGANDITPHRPILKKVTGL